MTKCNKIEATGEVILEHTSRVNIASTMAYIFAIKCDKIEATGEVIFCSFKRANIASTIASVLTRNVTNRSTRKTYTLAHPLTQTNY